MPNHNPTIHNYLCNSVQFNSGLSVTEHPHGADNMVEFAHIPVFPTAFNFPGDFAIHAWVKIDGTSSICTRIIQTPAKGVNGVTHAFMLGLLGDDTFFTTPHNALRVGMAVDSSEGTTTVITLNPVIRDNTWHHIVGQSAFSDGPAIQIYVDGCLQTTIVTDALDYTLGDNTGGEPAGTNTTGLVVGWDAALEGPLVGSIASLALINRLLTSEEIKTLAMGTANIIGVKSTLKSVVVAWWRMGDKDPVGLATLNDSVGTNHLTTINISAGNLKTDVPAERPREHQYLHLSTGCDELKCDPDSVGFPFIWDSFSVLDDEDAIPHGWFGAKEVTDKFYRIPERGRLGGLQMLKVSAANQMFITNAASSVFGQPTPGGTIAFGHSKSRVTNEVCLEGLFYNDNLGGDGIIYFGWVKNPHSFASPNDPATGIYLKWDMSVGGDLEVIISDSTNQKTAGPFNNVLPAGGYFCIKLCFTYYAAAGSVVTLIVKTYIDNVLISTLTEISTNPPYPAAGDPADVLLGHYNNDDESGGDYELRVGYIKASFRGIGCDKVQSLVPPP